MTSRKKQKKTSKKQSPSKKKKTTVKKQTKKNTVKKKEAEVAVVEPTKKLSPQEECDLYLSDGNFTGLQNATFAVLRRLYVGEMSATSAMGFARNTENIIKTVRTQLKGLEAKKDQLLEDSEIGEAIEKMIK